MDITHSPCPSKSRTGVRGPGILALPDISPISQEISTQGKEIEGISLLGRQMLAEAFGPLLWMSHHLRKSPGKFPGRRDLTGTKHSHKPHPGLKRYAEGNDLTNRDPSHEPAAGQSCAQGTITPEATSSCWHVPYMLAWSILCVAFIPMLLACPVLGTSQEPSLVINPLLA